MDPVSAVMTVIGVVGKLASLGLAAADDTRADHDAAQSTLTAIDALLDSDAKSRAELMAAQVKADDARVDDYENKQTPTAPPPTVADGK